MKPITILAFLDIADKSVNSNQSLRSGMSLFNTKFLLDIEHLSLDPNSLDKAITAMVKPTVRSGGVRSRSKTVESPSPLARAASASDMRVQIDMSGRLP